MLDAPCLMETSRHAIPSHFTASGLVVCRLHVLLVHHQRIGAWVPPGGHVEGNELPHEAAIREIKEETGLDVEIISDSMPETGDKDAFFLPQPLYQQAVLALEKEQRFYHVDLAYLCRPLASLDMADKLPRLTCSSELKEARWVPINEAEELPLAKNVKGALTLVSQKLRALALRRAYKVDGK